MIEDTPPLRGCSCPVCQAARIDQANADAIARDLRAGKSASYDAHAKTQHWPTTPSGSPQPVDPKARKAESDALGAAIRATDANRGDKRMGGAQFRGGSDI